MVLMFTTCWRYDSIVYNMAHGNDEDALALIRKVYAKDEDPQHVLDDLKKKSTKSSSKVTMWEAVSHERYRRATWVAFALCFFQQQTGLDGIMIYSNTIFQEMSNRGSISFTPKQGSYIVGTLSLIVSLLAPWPVGTFKRKTLLFWGQFGMAVSLALTAVAYILEKDILIIVFICIFISCFQVSQGPIAWMYAGEVAVDTGLGICVLALYLSLLEKAITMEFMVHSRMGPTGMFFFLSAITFIGAVFIQVFVRETKGLNDKQKKELFTPKKFLEQDQKDKDIELAAKVIKS